METLSLYSSIRLSALAVSIGIGKIKTWISMSFQM
jgi:hypothetical protein